MKEPKITDIAELRTSEHALDLIYYLYTHIDSCCSLDGIREMHRIERELNVLMGGEAVRFSFKDNLKSKQGIVKEVLQEGEQIIVDFEDGVTFTTLLVNVEDVLFGEVTIEESIWSPVLEKVIRARKKLFALGLVSKEGAPIKPNSECSKEEVEQVALYLALEAGNNPEKVATFE